MTHASAPTIHTLGFAALPAATLAAPDPRGTAVLAGVALVAAAVYAARCWRRPYRRCPHCAGTGYRDDPTQRRHPRPCRWCRGTRLRLRLGRRAFNLLYRIRRQAVPARKDK